MRFWLHFKGRDPNSFITIWRACIHQFSVCFQVAGRRRAISTVVHPQLKEVFSEKAKLTLRSSLGKPETEIRPHAAEYITDEQVRVTFIFILCFCHLTFPVDIIARLSQVVRHKLLTWTNLQFFMWIITRCLLFMSHSVVCQCEFQLKVYLINAWLGFRPELEEIIVRSVFSRPRLWRGFDSTRSRPRPLTPLYSMS